MSNPIKDRKLYNSVAVTVTFTHFFDIYTQGCSQDFSNEFFK